MSSSTTIAICQCESSYLTTFDHTDVSGWIKTDSINPHNNQFWNIGTIFSGDEVAWILAKFYTTRSGLPKCNSICHLNVIGHFQSFFPLFSLSLFHCFTLSLMTCSWWGWVNICKNLRRQTQNTHIQIHFVVLNYNVVLVKWATLTMTYFLSIYSWIGVTPDIAPPPLTLQKIASVSWRSWWSWWSDQT